MRQYKNGLISKIATKISLILDLLSAAVLLTKTNKKKLGVMVIFIWRSIGWRVSRELDAHPVSKCVRNVWQRLRRRNFDFVKSIRAGITALWVESI